MTSIDVDNISNFSFSFLRVENYHKNNKKSEILITYQLDDVFHSFFPNSSTLVCFSLIEHV